MFGLQDELLARVARRGGRPAAAPTMGDVVAARSRRRCWSLLAGVFSAADAALASFSRARAEELRRRGPARRRAGWWPCSSDPPRYLNTALLLRLLCEIAAIVLVTRWSARRCTTAPGGRPC